VNRYSKEKLLKLANVISTIFYLDKEQKEDVINKLRNLVDTLKNLSEDEYNDVKRWLEKVSDPRLSDEEERELNKIIDESKPWEVEEMINNFAKNIGDMKEKAKVEGKVEEKEDMIKNLLRVGVEIEKIKEASGLSEEEIKRIKDRTKH
jgi:predicted transposase/invertase (TIGR01784 family)